MARRDGIFRLIYVFGDGRKVKEYDVRTGSHTLTDTEDYS